jgi:hypothetical protein
LLRACLYRFFSFLLFSFQPRGFGRKSKTKLPKTALFFLKTSAGTSEIFHRKFCGGFLRLR